MTPTETADILRQFNEWQKGDGPLDYSPNGLINAVDTAIEMIGRLEAAERNLNCCRAEREEAAALFLSVKTRLTEERDALRSEIETIKKVAAGNLDLLDEK